MTDQPEEMPIIEVIYLGRYKGKSPAVMVIPVALCDRNPERAIEICSIFGRKDARFRVVGGVYSVEGEIGENGRLTTYRPATAKYLRPYRDGSGIVAAWQARDQTQAMVEAAEKRENAAAKDTALSRLLKSLGYIYRALPPNQRQAFKVWLLNELDKS